MAFSIDDPRLTAYALGELEGDEAAELESWLADNAEATAAVTELRSLSTALTSEFKAEADAVSPGDPSAVLAAAEQSDGKSAEPTTGPGAEPLRIEPRSGSGGVGWLTGLALAACVLIMGVISVTQYKEVVRVTVEGGSTSIEQEVVDAMPGDASKSAAFKSDAGTAARDDSDGTAGPRQRGQHGQQRPRENRESLGRLALEESKKVNRGTTWTVNKTGRREPVQNSGRYGKGYTDSYGVGGGAKPNSGLKPGDAAPRNTPGPVATPKKPVAPPAAEPRRSGRVKDAIGLDKQEVQRKSRALDEKNAKEKRATGAGERKPDQEVARPRVQPVNPDPADTSPSESDQERYVSKIDNPFKDCSSEALSTFSIDVDTASYANVRRFITRRTRPPVDAVRIEELVNYFQYSYEGPKDDKPFAASLEVASCPWQPKNRLVRVALKGKEIDKEQRPFSNLVFLLDVSGSMNRRNKLPLLKTAFQKLVNQLGENDRVAIVVYAGASGIVLPSTPCDAKTDIMNSLRRLRAGGSTNGGAGLRLAYQVAVDNFIEGGTNRVILATDGDFNVGIRNRSDMVSFIGEKAKSGVFLTVLGFGSGNFNDALLEQVADKGNGNYFYIDSEREATKVLVEQMGGTLVTIAKDVKLQVEFNPRLVASHRLIGYENRVLAHTAFNDDTKDAGEIGAGHTVTALYEITPRGDAGELELSENADKAGVDPLRYQAGGELTKAGKSSEILTLKVRYKKPDGDKSELLTFPCEDSNKSFARAGGEFQFAASVAALA